MHLLEHRELAVDFATRYYLLVVICFFLSDYDPPDTIVVLPANTSNAFFQQRNIHQYNLIGKKFMDTFSAGTNCR